MPIIDPIASYARSNPQNQAVVDLESGRRYTYAELHTAVDRLAAWLVRELGPARGARIATLSRNCAEMLMLQHAGVRAGTIFVPLNWRLAPAEIEVLAEDAGPEIVFHDEDLAPPAAAARAMHISDVSNLGSARSCPPPEARLRFDDVATLLYTSGTSGRPKGVMLSEENIFWGCANFIYAHDVTMQSVFLCDMPLFHTAGLFAAARVPIQAGASVLISKGFDAPTTLSRLTDPDLNVTHYFSVPQMSAWIWNEPGFDPQQLKKLSCWAIGGAPNPRANAERFIKAGIRIADGFGMSEICSGFGMPPQDFTTLLAKTGSCGPPLLSLETRIVDDDGNDLPPGQVGELWLRGPSITRGYWNQPEATEQAFSDGWFKTGDAGMLDSDGFLYVVDRKKDMFISGGENVYPAEVEAVIAELPDVAESAVVGVPDERWGEVGRLYVIPVPGRTVLGDDILEHCRQRLAKFKVPKTAVITDTLPRTASGKLQKHVLKAQAMQEIASD